MESDQGFLALGRAGQTRRLARLAATALRSYPIRPVRVTRLAQGWNAGFAVVDDRGQRFVLRVHRPDGPSAERIGSELAWLAALGHDTDLVVPRPASTVEGKLYTVTAAPGVPEARVCDLLGWIDGRFRYDSLRPAHLRRVGALAARLQEHGRSWPRPEGFRRPRVTAATALADTLEDDLGVELGDHIAGLVTAADPDWDGGLVREVVNRARAARDAVGADAGLQHADLHYENVLFTTGSGIAAIDFDDCGFGPYVYDLAVILTEMWGRADYAALRSALFDGYRTVRPLPVDHEAAVDTFVAFRLLQLLAYRLEHRTEPLFRAQWHEHTGHTLALLSRLLRG